MATPITEYIAENIKDGINAISVANGFNYDLTAVRRRRIDFGLDAPVDGIVLIVSREEEPPDERAISVQRWFQIYWLIAIVLESDDAVTSIETKIAKVRDDLRKKLLEDPSRGGKALDTLLRPAFPLEDLAEGLTGIVLEIAVDYRTQYSDPYTQA